MAYDWGERAEMHSFHARLVRELLFPLHERLRGTSILRALKLLEESQYWSRDQLSAWQIARLQSLLLHAYENTRFYRRRFDQAGFNPRAFRSFSDLNCLPCLTKQDLKESLEDLLAQNYTSSDIHQSTTGGTTADFTVFYRDNESLNFKLASTIRHDRWTGWDIGEREAVVWPASIDFRGKRTWRTATRNAVYNRKLRLFAGVLDEATLHSISSQLQRFRPRLMRGFPNPMSVIAEFVDRHPEYEVSPGAIKSVGEALSPATRTLLSRVFRCEVYNCYLSRESGTLASECDAHRNMHINAETLYVEFLHAGQPVPYGTPGQVIVTDLYNYGMPLIRYQVGDLATPLEGSCPCGRTLPLMEMTAGRESDFLLSPHDGSYIMGLSLLVPFVENPSVGQLQIIQDSIQHITLRISKGKDFRDENLARFRQTLDQIFHGKMTCTVEFVDEIPHDASGKYRFVVRRPFRQNPRK